jgi:hypothetical protein
VPIIVGGLLAIGGTVIGAIASTATTYLLALRKEAVEARTWRRDRCLEAYSEFVGLVNIIVTAAGECFYAECGTEKHAKNRQIVFDRFPELTHMSFRIMLLGPPTLAEPLNDLLQYLDKEMAWKLIQCPKICNKREEIGEKFPELNTRFMMTARHDLGIDPI